VRYEREVGDRPYGIYKLRAVLHDRTSDAIVVHLSQLNSSLGGRSYRVRRSIRTRMRLTHEADCLTARLTAADAEKPKMRVEHIRRSSSGFFSVICSQESRTARRSKLSHMGTLHKTIGITCACKHRCRARTIRNGVNRMQALQPLPLASTTL